MSIDSTMLLPGTGCFAFGMPAISASSACVLHGRIEQHAPLRVHDLVAITDVAVQRALVRALDAALADVRRRGVVAAVDPLEILEADAADVADRVRARLAERIVARERLLDVDAREAMAAHGERRGLLLGEVAELHALEAAMRAHEVAQRLVLARIDEPERLELLQRRRRGS